MKRHFTRSLLGILFFIGAVANQGCKTANRRADTSNIRANRGQDGINLPPPKQWEVRTEQSETVLTDIFYADDSQNDQLIPTQLDTLPAFSQPNTQISYGIKTLIYPTIGNPNLYVKKLAPTADSFLVVTRLPKASIDGRYTRTGTFYMGTTNELVTLNPNENLFKFTLIPVSTNPAGNRQCTEFGKCDRSGVSISPTRIVLQDSTGLPASLAVNETVTFIFDSEVMDQVNAGMYDIRFETSIGGTSAEFQYNALKVFDAPSDAYHVINITDTQMSISDKLDKFGELTLGTTQQIVDNLVAAYSGQLRDKDLQGYVQGAAFITFNGDLHNSGSPLTVRASDVANTYHNEATAIVQVLRRLPQPIFLTIGNHDGYASVGYAPAISKIFLDRTISKEAPEEEQERFDDYLKLVSKVDPVTQAKGPFMGGWHRDVVAGSFVKRFSGYNNSGTISQNWDEIPRDARNVILYDGFYQWRKTYGPLYSSWRFGQNHYINLNTFDLRQHRRTGWGMYTVNYGGSISPFQMGWLNHEIEIASKVSGDIVLIGHHDPRGGHNGHDYPYYFSLVDYGGMDESIVNYLGGEVVNPKLCKNLPDSLKGDNQKMSCLHDGLQEWMKPDEDFDCEDQFLEKPSSANRWFRLCSEDKIGQNRFRHLNYSGYVLINKIAETAKLRTVILGHTHYSSLEVYQPGSYFAPKFVRLAVAKAQSPQQNFVDGLAERNKSVELYQNPMRMTAMGAAKSSGRETTNLNETETKKFQDAMRNDEQGYWSAFLAEKGHSFETQLQDHEVAVVRLTSSSNLSSQMLNGNDFYGYSFLSFGPILQNIAPYHFAANGGQASFEKVKEVPIDRTKDIRYRKFAQIEREFPQDAEYLQNKGLKDSIDSENPFRHPEYALKTEGESGK
jgi:hypothetical protein